MVPRIRGKSCGYFEGQIAKVNVVQNRLFLTHLVLRNAYFLVTRTHIRALANVQNAQPVERPGGRPRKVSKEGVEVLAAKLTQKSLELKSVHMGEEFEDLVKGQMASESKNGFGMGNAEEISDKTLDRLIAEIKATKRVAKVKTPGRTAAYEDIRSPIALCAVLSNVFEKVDPSLFISSDDVSILVNDNREPHIVLTTQEADKLLRKTNTSVSVTNTEVKHRVVSFNISISAGFSTVCKVVKFADRSFKGVLEKPKVIDVGKHLYFCFYPYGMEDEIVNESVYRKCILPSADALRKELKEGEGTGMSDAEVHTQSQQSSSAPAEPTTGKNTTSSNSSSSSSNKRKFNQDSRTSTRRATTRARSQSSQSSSDDKADDRSDGGFSTRGVEAGVEAALEFMSTATPEQIRKRYEWICLACDGAYGQVTAITDHMSDYIYKYALYVLMMKYGAGRSLSESPNDLGWMHSILHKCFKKYKFKYGPFDDPPGKVWADMKRFLKNHLDGASFLTVWRCFCHAEEFLDKAFTKSNLRSAFRASGIAPLDYVTVMSHNPHFRTLEKGDAEWIISEAIPQAAAVCAEKGYVPEDDLKRILAVRPNIDNSAPRKGKALNDMATNRQRALFLNHPEFLVELRRKKEEKEAAALAAAERKAASDARKNKKGTASSTAPAAVGQDGGDAPRGCAVATTTIKKKRKERDNQEAGVTVSVASCHPTPTSSVKRQKVSADSENSVSAGIPPPCSTPNCGKAWCTNAGPQTKCGWPYCRLSFCAATQCKAYAITHRAECPKRKNKK